MVVTFKMQEEEEVFLSPSLLSLFCSCSFDLEGLDYGGNIQDAGGGEGISLSFSPLGHSCRRRRRYFFLLLSSLSFPLALLT